MASWQAKSSGDEDVRTFDNVYDALEYAMNRTQREKGKLHIHADGCAIADPTKACDCSGSHEVDFTDGDSECSVLEE